MFSYKFKVLVYNLAITFMAYPSAAHACTNVCSNFSHNCKIETKQDMYQEVEGEPELR